MIKGFRPHDLNGASPLVIDLTLSTDDCATLPSAPRAGATLWANGKATLRAARSKKKRRLEIHTETEVPEPRQNQGARGVRRAGGRAGGAVAQPAVVPPPPGQGAVAVAVAVAQPAIVPPPAVVPGLYRRAPGSMSREDIVEICEAIDIRRTHAVIQAAPYDNTPQPWRDDLRAYVLYIQPTASEFAIMAVGLVLLPMVGLNLSLQAAVNGGYIAHIPTVSRLCFEYFFPHR
jgi:hypothetical protein